MKISIEQLLHENTQAMRELTAALNAMRHLPTVAVTPEAPTALPISTITVMPPAPEPIVTSPEPIPETPEKPVTIADVKPLFVKMVAADRPKAVALLKEFGCAKLPELKSEQFADFYARLEAF